MARLAVTVLVEPSKKLILGAVGSGVELVGDRDLGFGVLDVIGDRGGRGFRGMSGRWRTSGGLRIEEGEVALTPPAASFDHTRSGC